ncbi:MAG: sulfatase [Planctomycetota bacterium]
MPEQLNVLHIICHDLGRCLGCYGAGIPTPHLDAFAASGVLMRRAFCQSPACSPSRACMLTGQVSHRHGVIGLANNSPPNDFGIDPDATTIVDDLNAAGYETIHVGIQHERRDIRDNRYRLETFERSTDGFADFAVDRAIELLEQRASTPHVRPWYLNVGTVEVHASQWQTLRGRRPGTYDPVALEDAWVPAFLPDKPGVTDALRREMASFQGCVQWFDRQMGRLFDALDRLGLRERTLVVFCTDHGISGERAKTTLYDAGVETAMMFRGPQITPKTVIDHLIPNHDLAPTLLEAAGVETSRDMQGRSFWSTLIGEPYTPHDWIVTQRHWHSALHPMRAVRDSRWHYIRHDEPRFRQAKLPHEVDWMDDRYERFLNELWPQTGQTLPSEELYDTLADPHELVDLATHPDCSGILPLMRRRLNGWLEDCEDVLFSPV